MSPKHREKLISICHDRSIWIDAQFKAGKFVPHPEVIVDIYKILEQILKDGRLGETPK